RRIADTEVRIPFAESYPGDDQQVATDPLAHEVARRAPGGLGEDVKRSARPRKLEATRKPLANEIALSPIVLDGGGHIVLQRCQTGVLHDARSANEGELLEFSHFLN